jgi:drug/metabolite transporter (DMT)-like permease
MSHLNRQERIGAGLAAGSMLLVGGSVAASSLLGGYPILGGQGIRYLVAGLVLAAWARLRRKPLPRPAGREWAWLAGLAVVGLAGCSVLLIQATRVAGPATVGVVVGAVPLVIVIAAALAAGHRPARRVLLAVAVVTAGSAAAQLGGAAGLTWSGPGLLLSAGALGCAAGTTLLAAPVLPRLGALAVTIYACGLAGILLLAAAAVARAAGGPPILRIPTATQLAALSYLAVAVTAVVCLAWYAAMKRLGVDRTGLFNGLIPITSLAAVALTGAGTITALQLLAALSVLVGVILGLGRARRRSGGVEVGDDAPHLRAGQAVRLGAQAEHELVAVDRVDVEVDGGTRAAGGRNPIQQRPGRFAALASMPSRSARPSSDIVTGTVAVGPSCGGRAASSTAGPTAYPRRATSKGNSGQQIFEWFVGGQDVHIYERYQDSAASLARRRPSLHRENQLGRPAWSNRSSRLGLRWC